MQALLIKVPLHGLTIPLEDSPVGSLADFRKLSKQGCTCALMLHKARPRGGDSAMLSQSEYVIQYVSNHNYVNFYAQVYGLTNC